MTDSIPLPGNNELPANNELPQSWFHRQPLSDRDFAWIAERLHSQCRISLGEGKREMVHARLGKRLRDLGLHSYKDYLHHLQTDLSGEELNTMVDLLTTNLTFFLREAPHFQYLRDTLIPSWRDSKKNRLRLWSAGCSSGEEAYSLAMLLLETMPPEKLTDTLILATDISARMLEKARAGIYPAAALREVPPHWRAAYFRNGRQGKDLSYRVNELPRRLVRLRPLNLAGPWPMQGRFDLIFCRNVMIYFDVPTQEELVRRFHDMLHPGGVLVVGHSESLTRIRHPLHYIQPSVYQRGGN